MKTETEIKEDIKEKILVKRCKEKLGKLQNIHTKKIDLCDKSNIEDSFEDFLTRYSFFDICCIANPDNKVQGCVNLISDILIRDWQEPDNWNDEYIPTNRLKFFDELEDYLCIDDDDERRFLDGEAYNKVKLYFEANKLKYDDVTLFAVTSLLIEYNIYQGMEEITEDSILNILKYI